MCIVCMYGPQSANSLELDLAVIVDLYVTIKTDTHATRDYKRGKVANY